MPEQDKKIFLGGLARKLVQDKLVSAEAASEVTQQSKINNTPFVLELMEKKLISSTELAEYISIEFGLPLLKLDSFDPKQVPQINNLHSEWILKHKILPLYKRENTLFLAIFDPTLLTVFEEAKTLSNLSIDLIIIEADRLLAIIDQVTTNQESVALGNLEEGLSNLDISSEADIQEPTKLLNSSDEAPVVKYVNKILVDAMKNRASDIHLEPFEKNLRIRFRQDGVLYEYASLPASLAPRFISRIKVMARLDISERRLPQDGRFKIRASKNTTIDFRVSTCPTLFGEKIVTRILDPSISQLGIDALGYEDFQRKIFLENISKPQGLILVTGPTGSGKTVSLYAAINILNTIESNISTCEDPVEINVPGVNQVNINVKAGLTFSSALRAFLRQDPDVIMVGEIRDLETAEIAIKAAQTGHLVLSTLHTNNAAETLNRLVSMGVPAYNLASSINLIVAQRLARKLCPDCKVKKDFPEHSLLQLGFQPEELQDKANLNICEPVGCRNCKGGYKGRLGIYEAMPISPKIAENILRGANVFEIARQAQEEGVWSLRKSGLYKVKTGVTSISELERVIKE